MKTKNLFLMLVSFLSLGMLAQDRTTVTATSSDISDNLDLRAVASIFGDSRDLEDFERRLNDPKAQISNLDLNRDGYVDYLRVIETTEQNLHLIVVQAVLEKDIFQDVATINVERRGDNVSVQVVGDVYMYGPNYIYEPVYVARPVIFNVFWSPYYRPYYSPWYFGYYPAYYTYWHPYPVYRYRRNVHVHINVHNHYNYVHTHNPRAIRLYDGRRQSGYERLNPGRSFTQRTQATNKHDYDVVRNTTRNGGTRATTRTTDGTRLQTNGVRTSKSEAANGTRQNATVRNTGRTLGEQPTRATGNIGRSTAESTRNQTVRATQPTRNGNIDRQEPAPTRNQTVRSESQPVRQSTPMTRQSGSRPETAQRNIPAGRSQSVQQAPQRQQSAPQGNGNRGGGNSGRRG